MLVSLGKGLLCYHMKMLPPQGLVTPGRGLFPLLNKILFRNYFRFVLDIPSIVQDFAATEIQLQEGRDDKILSKADVPGRIHKPQFWQFWKETLQANSTILTTLEFGYKMPLDSWPPASELEFGKEG